MKLSSFLKDENKKHKVIAVCIILLALLIGVGNHYIFPIASIMSFDYATSVIPGWHTTIFPPNFIISLTFSTLLFLQIIAILILLFFKSKSIINEKVIEYVNIGLLVLGCVIALPYFVELFISWYSGYIYEQFAFYNRVFGIYWWLYFMAMLMAIILPQLFWFRRVRKSLWATLIICLCLNIGGIVERIVIITTTMARDYLPSSWRYEYEFNYKFLLLFIPILGLIGLIFYISKVKKD